MSEKVIHKFPLVPGTGKYFCNIQGDNIQLLRIGIQDKYNVVFWAVYDPTEYTRTIEFNTVATGECVDTLKFQYFDSYQVPEEYNANAIFVGHVWWRFIG